MTYSPHSARFLLLLSFLTSIYGEGRQADRTHLRAKCGGLACGRKKPGLIRRDVQCFMQDSLRDCCYLLTLEYVCVVILRVNIFLGAGSQRRVGDSKQNGGDFWKRFRQAYVVHVFTTRRAVGFAIQLFCI